MPSRPHLFIRISKTTFNCLYSGGIERLEIDVSILELQTWSWFTLQVCFLRKQLWWLFLQRISSGIFSIVANFSKKFIFPKVHAKEVAAGLESPSWLTIRQRGEICFLEFSQNEPLCYVRFTRTNEIFLDYSLTMKCW